VKKLEWHSTLVVMIIICETVFKMKKLVSVDVKEAFKKNICMKADTSYFSDTKLELAHKSKAAPTIIGIYKTLGTLFEVASNYR